MMGRLILLPRDIDCASYVHDTISRSNATGMQTGSASLAQRPGNDVLLQFARIAAPA